MRIYRIILLVGLSLAGFVYLILGLIMWFGPIYWSRSHGTGGEFQEMAVESSHGPWAPMIVAGSLLVLVGALLSLKLMRRDNPTGSRR